MLSRFVQKMYEKKTNWEELVKDGTLKTERERERERVCVFFFFKYYLLSMLHYNIVILHAYVHY